ncbi:DUF6065 family protein [Kiloniella sp.]|uniref:DUF6065 family protein n=1 Tax=Kiloniella sp. TaxID=1938587 RepID=UPI003B01FD72
MISFYKCWPDLPDPILPRPDLRGEIPARALKFCEPFTRANSSGALICPPMDFTLTWTGTEILADLKGIEETILVERLYLPEFADYWKENAPAKALEAIPPFLEAIPERGVIQVWSGLFARTKPGISSWIRSPVNWGNSGAYSVLEGVVETDWWAGPLFFVIQMQKTDFPISFYYDDPFMQVVPVDRNLLDLGSGSVPFENVTDAPQDFWDSMVDFAEKRNSGRPGSYRREARKRRKACPMTGSGLIHEKAD